MLSASALFSRRCDDAVDACVRARAGMKSFTRKCSIYAIGGRVLALFKKYVVFFWSVVSVEDS